MRNSLLPTRAADTGMACMSCMTSSSNMQRCSGCAMVKYCNRQVSVLVSLTHHRTFPSISLTRIGRSYLLNKYNDSQCQVSVGASLSNSPHLTAYLSHHSKSNISYVPRLQLTDWKKCHKSVCKIIRAFRPFARDTPDHPLLGECLNIATKYTAFEKQAKKGLIADLQQNKLSDSNWLYAKKLIIGSPRCAVCLKTDFDHGVDSLTQWKCCPKCHHGWTCPEHSAEYLSTKHTTEMCNAFLQLDSIERFRYDHTINYGDRFMFVPQSTRSTPMKSFPKSWDAWFNQRAAQEYGMRHRMPAEFFPASTFLLSQVNTILMGFYRHDRDAFARKEVLTIHVAGANPAFECEGGAPTCIWEEIMHVLPAVRRMHVVFVGPEVRITQELTQIQECPECQRKGRVRMQGFHELTYHDYRASRHFTQPDFVAAFNTGMYDECTESWKTSLRAMLDLDVPCLFTSYNLDEAEQDMGVLRQVDARTLDDSPVLNPFRSMVPAIDDTTTDEQFFYANMYYSCFKGRI